MKNLLLILLTVSLAIIVSCSDDSAEVNCSVSDVRLTIISQTIADCDNPGTLEVAGSGGNTPYMFSVDGINFQESPIFTGLFAGPYTVTIEDNSGCSSQVDLTIEPGPNAILLSLSATESECGDNTGSITATASGGDGNYTFSVDGGTPQTSNVFEFQGRGDHNVTVIDGTDCASTQTIQVTTTVTWSGDIRSILSSNCAISGCHDGSTSLPNWTILSEVQSSAVSIASRTASGSMPPEGSGRSLSESQIEEIACWVEDGARDN